MSYSVAFNTFGYWLVVVALLFMTGLTLNRSIKNVIRKKAIKGLEFTKEEFWCIIAVSVIVALIPYFNTFMLLCNLLSYLNKDRNQAKFEEKCQQEERNNR